MVDVQAIWEKLAASEFADDGDWGEFLNNDLPDLLDEIERLQEQLRIETRQHLEERGAFKERCGRLQARVAELEAAAGKEGE